MKLVLEILEDYRKNKVDGSYKMPRSDEMVRSVKKSLKTLIENN
jgi:hypothetical protein